MTNRRRRTPLVEAMLAGPGPRDLGTAVRLAVKGLAMGSADLVPGVSGGTVALITGIYGELLNAVSSLGEGLRAASRGHLTEGVAAVHTRFLVCLAAGLLTALVTLARLMHYLLAHHPVPTWGMFFGLVAASVLIIGKEARVWQGWGIALFLVGAAAAYYIVGLIPVTTPQAPWFIFLSGMIAICAMILPGISGAFLLLILSKYQYITGALRNPFDTGNLATLAVFATGCLTGLLGFSRFLSYMIDRHYQATMAVLTGLMFGSMRKIWPWKEITASVVIRGKEHVVSTTNILPPAFGAEFFLTLLLAAAGFAAVLALHRAGGDGRR